MFEGKNRISSGEKHTYILYCKVWKDEKKEWFTILLSFCTRFALINLRSGYLCDEKLKSNKPYTLKINGKKYRIKEGEQIITIKP